MAVELEEAEKVDKDTARISGLEKETSDQPESSDTEPEVEVVKDAYFRMTTLHWEWGGSLNPWQVCQLF